MTETINLSEMTAAEATQVRGEGAVPVALFLKIDGITYIKSALLQTSESLTFDLRIVLKAVMCMGLFIFFGAVFMYRLLSVTRGSVLG